jgi:hypothetical protein
MQEFARGEEIDQIFDDLEGSYKRLERVATEAMKRRRRSQPPAHCRSLKTAHAVTAQQGRGLRSAPDATLWPDPCW